MSTMDDFHKDVLDNLYDGVYFVNPDRQITYWNKGAERISGFRSEQVLGRRCADNILMHVDDKGTILCQVACPLAATMRDGEVREVEVYLHHAKGHRVPVRVRAAPMRDADGRIIGAVEAFSDNSAMLAAQQRVQELNYASLTDPLTGVGNRRYIDGQAQVALAEFERHGIECGLLFVDLDDFKAINDTYGHEVGDKVLSMVAETLRHNVRVSDSVGRWGGDEFVVVLRHINLEHLIAIAGKLRLLVEQSQLMRGQQTLQVTASIGAALARSGDSFNTLLSRADTLLYQGKAGGGNFVAYAA